MKLSFLLSHLGISKDKLSYEIGFKSKRQIAEGTYEFVFEKPEGFHFNAGQHVRMTLLNPPETDGEGNSRFLTLANTPSEKDLIVAMRMTDSAFKKSLAKMQTGEKVLIQILLHSPHGSFVIHDDASKPVVFLAGGIGIVPAYAMIKDAIERNLPHKIFLFYSNRRPEDAPYLAELEELAKQHPTFKLIATMTTPEKSVNSWKGETGAIDQAMLKRYIDDLKSPIYYIVGLSEMVNAMKALVKDIGVGEDQIRSEDFSRMKMSIMNMGGNPAGGKKHLLYAGGAVLAVIVIAAHAGVATMLLKNLSYFTIGLILIIVLFKLIVLFKIKHNLSKKNNHKL